MLNFDFVAPVTFIALTSVKLASPSVTVKLLRSFEFKCAVALPVNVKIAVVSLVFVITGVKPSGAFATVTLLNGVSIAPENLSPVNVKVTAVEIEPSFAAASTNVVAL